MRFTDIETMRSAGGFTLEGDGRLIYFQDEHPAISGCVIRQKELYCFQYNVAHANRRDCND